MDSIDNDYTIVTYYTTEPPYENLVRRLEKSCKRWSLPFQAHARAPFDTWKQGIRYKAVFLRDMFERGPDTDLVWLDADSEIVSEPRLLKKTGADFIYFQSAPRRAGTGIMYLRRTPAVRKLIEEWAYMALEEPPSSIKGDEYLLGDLLEVWDTSDIKIADWPLGYYHIVNGQTKSSSPIITHTRSGPARRKRDKKVR